MEENEDIIIEKLKKINVDYDSLKPFMKKYLARIEDLVKEKSSVRSTGIKMIKDSRFSLSSISQSLECSRTTLYNHGELLKHYIELSVDLFMVDDPYITYDKLKASIAELEAKVNKMVSRDIDTELLRMENENHLKKLKENYDQINRLQIRNAELSKEVHELRKNASKSNQSFTSVISLREDK